MDDLLKLIHQLDAEDLDQARQMTGEQKLRAGADLFDDACRWTLAGIRHQYPAWSEALVQAELVRRLDIDRSDEEGLL